jgi:hypothetical protein
MDSIQRAQVTATMTNLAAPAQAEKQEAPQAASGDSVQIGQNDQQPKAKWTILSFIAADCNLEPYQVRNVDNMELAPTDPKTNIIVQLDRGPDPSSIDGGWTNCRRYEVLNDSVADKLGSKVVEDMGATNMAKPQTLTDFIVWGVQKYPSEHVALILNDHGGGFTGALADDTQGGFMSVPELAKALKDAEAITGKKIDIVGFDACLMAETEVARELQGAADILLASEETEGGPGWTYSPMLGGKNLTAALDQMRLMKLDATPEQFAKIVVDVNSKHSRDIPTFSAVDLNKMDTLATATNVLAEAIIASPDKAGIKQAIKQSESYGGGYNPYKDIHDQYDMCEKIVNSPTITDKGLKNAAQGVIDTLKTAIIANENNGTSHKNSHGLSIFAPTTAGPSGPGYKWGDLQFAKETKWGEAMASLGRGDMSAAQAEETQKTPDVWPDGSVRK